VYITKFIVISIGCKCVISQSRYRPSPCSFGKVRLLPNTEMTDKLTPKQARFALEYPVDSNATQAAIRAGYSARSAYSQGQRLLKKDEVRRRIEGHMDDIKEKVGITIEGIQTELKEIRDAAKEAGQFAAAARCEELRGKTVGAFVDRQEIEQTHEDRLEARIRDAEQRRHGQIGSE